MIRLSNVRGLGRLRRAAGVIGLPPILSILPRRCCPSSRSRLDVCDGDEVDDEVDAAPRCFSAAVSADDYGGGVEAAKGVPYSRLTVGVPAEHHPLEKRVAA